MKILCLLIILTSLLGCRTKLHEATQPPSISIHKAARTANIEALSQHLKAGTDPNLKPFSGGTTPLVMAKEEEVVKILLENGADVNDVGYDGNAGNALHWHLSPNIISLLVKHGADVNAVNGDGNTPMHIALREYLWRRTLKTVEILLALGANVNAKNNNGHTPLDVYLDKGHLYIKSNKGLRNDILKLLLNNGAKSTLVELKRDTK